MEDVKTSIIICHWKNRLIERCLKSLENVNAQKIIASSDLTFKTDKAEMYYPAFNEPTYKRNWGANIFAKHKYLIFMDDDVRIFTGSSGSDLFTILLTTFLS